MISIKKCDDISEIGYKLPVEAYILFEDGAIKLACIFEVHKNKTKILDIKTFDKAEKLYYDAVIRTVAAYSLSRGIERTVSYNEGIADILMSLGFIKENSFVSAKNALLVRHQCGEKK